MDRTLQQQLPCQQHQHNSSTGRQIWIKMTATFEKDPSRVRDVPSLSVKLH